MPLYGYPPVAVVRATASHPCPARLPRLAAAGARVGSTGPSGRVRGSNGVRRQPRGLITPHLLAEAPGHWRRAPTTHAMSVRPYRIASFTSSYRPPAAQYRLAAATDQKWRRLFAGSRLSANLSGRRLRVHQSERVVHSHDSQQFRARCDRGATKLDINAVENRALAPPVPATNPRVRHRRPIRHPPPQLILTLKPSLIALKIALHPGKCGNQLV